VSNTVGYSLGCVTSVKYNLTQGEDATGNQVSSTMLGCAPGCWNGDYRNRRYWAQIPSSAALVTGGADYYGALAPGIKFQGGGTYRDICPTVCYCEGPVAEGVTVTEYLDRYETRWMALLVEGLLYYGRVDGTLIQTPLDLFPDPLSDTATHIALSFDANARPVFAYEDDGTVYVRRYVAGVPTTYSWIGTEPCLFFNGVINFDDSQTDVVCYYLTASGGALYARFQRENFGVENLVLEDPGLDSLMAVDRGRGVLASFMVIELSGKRILASVYPVWPPFKTESIPLTLTPLNDAAVTSYVVLAPVATDAPTVTLGVIDDADCLSIYFILPPEGDFQALSLAPIDDADLFSTIVVSAGHSDSVSTTLGTIDDGDIYANIVSGGSYAESSTTTLSPINDADCITE